MVTRSLSSKSSSSSSSSTPSLNFIRRKKLVVQKNSQKKDEKRGPSKDNFGPSSAEYMMKKLKEIRAKTTINFVEKFEKDVFESSYSSDEDSEERNKRLKRKQERKRKEMEEKELLTRGGFCRVDGVVVTKEEAGEFKIQIAAAVPLEGNQKIVSEPLLDFVDLSNGISDPKEWCDLQKTIHRQTVDKDCECQICFCCFHDDFDDDGEEEKLSILKLVCNHIFHRDCLLQWIKCSKFCPVCKIRLEDEDATMRSDLKSLRRKKKK